MSITFLSLLVDAIVAIFANVAAAGVAVGYKIAKAKIKYAFFVIFFYCVGNGKILRHESTETSKVTR